MRLLRWFRTDGIVAAVYLAASLILTWPLAANFATHIPGTNVDEFAFVWNIWWFRHAVFDLGVDPFTTTSIYYPLGVSLSFYTLAILNDILALPLSGLFGFVSASNTVIVFALTMSAYGAFCLARDALSEQNGDSRVRLAASFIGGLVYAYPASRFVYLSLGHYNVVSAEWLPFYVLFFLRMLRALKPAPGGPGLRGAWRPAAASGLFLFLALLTEMTFGVFLFLLSVLLLCFTPRRVVLSRGFVLSAAVLVVSAVVPYLPVLVFLARDLAQGGAVNFPGWGYADLLSADLIGLLTPTGLHTFWAAAGEAARARFTDVNTVFIGYAVPVLAAAAAVFYRRRVAVWVTGAAASLILALGPVLHINGEYLFDLDGLTVTLPLPYAVFHYIPIFSMNRVPNRFSVTLSLCLAVLAAFAVAWMLARLRRRMLRAAVAAVLAGLVVLDGISIPIPLSDARVPSVYAEIAKEPGDFAVLPIPLGWRESFGTLGAEQTQIQYYQSVHEKRLLNGNASRVTPFKFTYFQQIPLIASIVDEEMYHQVDEGRRQQDRLGSAEILYFFDIRYVVLHAATPGRLPYADTITRTRDYVLQALPLEPAFAGDGAEAYRVVQPPAKSAVNIDVGAPGSSLYLGEGWNGDEADPAGRTFRWAGARTARLFVPLRLEGDYRVTFQAMPFVYPGSAGQTVALRVNGRALSQALQLGESWSELSVRVPAEYWRPGLNELALDFGYVETPSRVLPGTRNIGTTGRQAAGEVTVRAAAGQAAILTGDGVEKPAERQGGKGYSIATLDASGSRLLDIRTFDVSDPAQAQALASHVAGLQQGAIVAVAGRDLPGGEPAPAVATALGSLGISAPAAGTALAAVGVKGAAAGQAAQQAGAGPVQVYLGPNQDRRMLAVAVDSIKVTRVE